MELESKIFWYRKIQKSLAEREAELERKRSQELPHEAEEQGVAFAKERLASLKEGISALYSNRHRVCIECAHGAGHCNSCGNVAGDSKHMHS